MYEGKVNSGKGDLMRQAKDLRLAFMLADVNPARDSVCETVAKFRQHGFRHLLALTEKGGLICLCSEPKMSQAIIKAIHSLEDGLNDGPDAA